MLEGESPSLAQSNSKYYCFLHLHLLFGIIWHHLLHLLLVWLIQFSPKLSIARLGPFTIGSRLVNVFHRMAKVILHKGSRHSSVDSSTLAIPWTEFESHPHHLRFYQFILELCDVKKTKKNKKRTGLARILKIYTICRNYALDKASKHFLNIINSFWDCHIEIVVYT